MIINLLLTIYQPDEMLFKRMSDTCNNTNACFLNKGV